MSSTVSTTNHDNIKIIVISVSISVICLIIILLVLLFCCLRRKSHQKEAPALNAPKVLTNKVSSKIHDKQEAQTPPNMEVTKETDKTDLPVDVSQRNHEPAQTGPSKLREINDNMQIEEKQTKDTKLSKVPSTEVAAKTDKCEKVSEPIEKNAIKLTEKMATKPDEKGDVKIDHHLKTKVRAKPKTIPPFEKRHKKVPSKTKVVPAYVDARHIRFFKGPVQPTVSDVQNVSLPPLVQPKVPVSSDEYAVPSLAAKGASSSIGFDASLTRKRIVAAETLTTEPKSCEKSISKTTSVATPKKMVVPVKKISQEKENVSDKRSQYLK